MPDNIIDFPDAKDEETETPDNAAKLKEALKNSDSPFVAVEEVRQLNSIALFDLTMIANWAEADEDKCKEADLQTLADNFRFIAFALEQSARGIMDTMFKSNVQPDLPKTLVDEIQAGKQGVTYNEYKAAVAKENPVTFSDDADVGGMLIAMHSNLDTLFQHVALAARAARLGGPEALRNLHTLNSGNPLHAVASSSFVIDRMYQTGAFKPEYWIFLPGDHRDSWNGVNLTGTAPDDLPRKFRIPCSTMYISEFPGVGVDDEVPTNINFDDGSWAPLFDDTVDKYALASIDEWIQAIK